MLYYGARFDLGLSLHSYLLMVVSTAAGSVGSVLLGSLVAGSLTSTALLAIGGRGTRAAPEITVRGPLSYAGPGSLGGTESAMTAIEPSRHVDASTIPPRGAGVDKKGDPAMKSSLTDRPDVKHNLVKRAIKCNSYTVDPDRVASALIVKLVQETLMPYPPATSGPNHANGATGPLRQAA